MQLESKIESLLFYKAVPVTLKELTKILGESEDTIRTGIESLRTSLNARGLSLIESDNTFLLGTAPAMSNLLEQLTKEELSRDIGKAGLETLTIILYLGPMTRSEIDYIRGVNSNFTLRTLLIRGLIERVANKQDSRSYLYKPTIDLLAHLGIQTATELNDYEKIREEYVAFKKGAEEQGAQEAVEQSESSSEPPSDQSGGPAANNQSQELTQKAEDLTHIPGNEAPTTSPPETRLE